MALATFRRASWKQWVVCGTFLIGVFGFASAEEGRLQPVSLELAREQGRQKSRFLKETKALGKPDEGVAPANLAEYGNRVAPVLTRSCIGCHGPKKAEGRLRLDQLNADLLQGPDAERWREVYEALSKAEMPPEDSKEAKLSEADRGAVVQWLGEELHKASLLQRASKTQSSLRRLTKYEYNYALQDLLGLDCALSQRLPPETASEDGFKNRSDLLQMSEMQFQTYREIALQALLRATVKGPRPSPVVYRLSTQEQMRTAASQKAAKVFELHDENAKKERNELHLWDRDAGKGVRVAEGKVLPLANASGETTPPISPVVWVLPRAGELKLNLDRFLPDEGVMRVRIRAGRSTLHPDEYASLRLVFSAHTSNNASFSQTISPRDMPVTAPGDAPQFIEFDIPLNDIQRNPFRKQTNPFPRRDEFLHIVNVSNARGGEERLKVWIDYIEIIAPYYAQWPPQSHTQLFFDSPQKADETRYGREVLQHFLRRIWRRPPNTEEVEAYLRLFAKYRPDFSTFEEAMVEVLATALASPEFLYLTSRTPPESSPQNSRRIDLFELANRLAVFLWASLPDEELVGLAEAGKLGEPAVLAAQVTRMLEDPRSKRFVRHFVDQWVGLERVQSVPHLTDGALREAMLEEPVAFFEHVLRGKGSAMDFLDCNYALLNERLASHYGIANVFGPHFRPVPLERRMNRGGLLTCAAMLTINSDGKDSHPVKRGVWLLQRILHDPPPPPPPNVPEVDLTDPRILKMTLKERIMNHRDHAACASCHARIDPWGIAFEHYDALGVYRTQIQNRPVDASSELFNRQTLNGVEGLKRYLLLERRDQFAQA
ncbi:MAG: hypothetical protein RLZZ142_529, partial [Verrucomicrobiota bacterium]